MWLTWFSWIFVISISLLYCNISAFLVFSDASIVCKICCGDRACLFIYIQLQEKAEWSYYKNWRSEVPEALFFHCYAHKLNLAHIIRKINNGLQELFMRDWYLFLSSWMTLPDAKSKSYQVNSHSKLVQMISLHYLDLHGMFHFISKRAEDQGNNTFTVAVGYDTQLSYILMINGKNVHCNQWTSVLLNKFVDAAFCCEFICDTIADVGCQCQV